MTGWIKTRRRLVVITSMALVTGVVAVTSVEAAEPLPGDAVRVSPAAGPQVEPAIAVNPVNPRNLIAGFIDQSRCGVAFSLDGGLTWSTSILAESTDPPPPGKQQYQLAGDPVVDFAADGTAYFLCMNTSNSNAVKTQFVYTSTDGGASWNDANPTLAISPGYGDDDKGDIVVDTNPASPYFGNVYVAATALPGPSGSGQVRLARSTDGAASFGAPVQVSDSNIGFAVGLAVGADGAVYAAWEEESPQGTSVALRIDRSDDGGVTFGTDTQFQLGGVRLGGVRPVPGRGNGFPYIGTDPVDPNLVYAVWAEPGPGPDDSDIMFSRSADKGATWSTAMRVNTDVNPVGGFSSQFWPTMAVDPTDGTINIIWYSDQNDPDPTDGAPRIDLYFTESSDNGISFDPPVRVTDSSSVPSGFFGDYLGIDAYGGVAHPIWIDTTLGSANPDAATTQIGEADLEIGVSESSDPAIAGESLTYDILITNHGPAEARDIVVEDQLPTGVTLSSASPGCVLTAGVVECSLSDPLPATETVSLQLTVDIDPSLVHDAGAAVSLTNQATVAGSQADTDLSNNLDTDLTTVLGETDLSASSLSAGFLAPALVGSPVSVDLQVDVTNSGPSGPVDTQVDYSAIHGTGLSVTVPASQTLSDLGLAETRTTASEATVTCNDPGSHVVTFGASASPLDAATSDPDSSNDSTTVAVTFDCLVPVAVNIHPGSSQNPINVKKGGAIPVAVLTTGVGEYELPLAFDAASIDVGAVRFGTLDDVVMGIGASESHGNGHLEDSYELNETSKDGDLDMILHFDASKVTIPPGTTELCVAGTFTSGGSTLGFLGCDQVTIKPK